LTSLQLDTSELRAAVALDLDRQGHVTAPASVTANAAA